MSLKDILVHIDAKENSAALETAIHLAQTHDAHLTGLYVMPEITIPTYAEVHIPASILAEQEKHAQEAATLAEAAFRAALERAGCAGEWRCATGYADLQIAQHARYTDLVVIGQAQQEGSFLSGYSDLPDQAIMAAARPVLFVPYIGVKKMPGKNIMIAWNGSREAVRAINDALPLLSRADRVHVVAVNPPSAEGDIPTADICLHLARHDVKAEGSQVVAKDIEVGDILLSRAADLDIDLLVMGAYGHNRLRESILGGATRHLLGHMTVPVLMSH